MKIEMHRIVSWVALLAAALVCGACGDKLPKATLITHMRVLGARTEVKGDPTRSTPKPGESATLTWSVVFPSTMQDDSMVSSLFIVCTAPTQFSGIPICQEFLDAAASPDQAAAQMLAGASMQTLSCKGNANSQVSFGALGAVCVTGLPKLNVAIEADSKIAKKLVRGILCRNGTPVLDPSNPELFQCDPIAGVKASDTDEIAVYGTIPIEHNANQANDNPSLKDATWKRGGKTWDEPQGMLPATDDDCVDAATMGLLPFSDGRADTITFEYPASKREKAGGVLETIEISAYATAGKLERRFIVFNPEDPVTGGVLKHSLAWNMSASERAAVKTSGKLVRFFFTILDRRGGFDVTERALCIRR